MESLPWRDIACPYCGEVFSVQLDISAGEQAYIEDCRVCCRPIELVVTLRGTDWSLQAHRDDD